MVTASNPYVDRFIYFDGDLSETIRELKTFDYDYVIDLQNNFRSGKIKRALGVQAYSIDKLNFRKFLLTTLRIDIMPDRHITLRSMDTAGRFGIRYDGRGLDYFIPDEDRIEESDIPATHHAGYIGLVIGASYATKRLPPDQLKKLCAAIDHPIILLGGPEDADAGEEAAEIDRGKIYNACGKFNLNESADLVRRSKLVISQDTGLQYIACAFGRPVLALWGSTSPELDVEPFYGDGMKEGFYENIRREPKLWCQPCSKFGRKTCPLGHFKCMKELDIGYIAERVMLRLR